MKEKIIGISLFVLIVFIIFVLISSTITLNKYNNISKTIDKDITDVKKEIEIKEREYKKLEEETNEKQKQIDNMNSYITTLKEKVKEYEK